MLAPLYQFGLLNDVGMIIIALIIGFLFGYIVETSGLANANNIRSAFYRTDWKVYNTIFTAVLTALILTYLAFYLGFLDISLITLSGLNLQAQVVGGFILGIGLVIGGYFPGADIAAAVTRKYDAWIFIFGSIVGILFYAQVYPSIIGFVKYLNLGRMTISDLFGIPYGIVILIVVMVVIASFYIFKGLTVKEGSTE